MQGHFGLRHCICFTLQGWQFKPDEPGCTADTVNGFTFIRQLYEKVGSKEKSVRLLSFGTIHHCY